jgi:hypothetical protein
MIAPEVAPIAAPLSVCVQPAKGRRRLATRSIFFMMRSYPILVYRIAGDAELRSPVVRLEAERNEDDEETARRIAATSPRQSDRGACLPLSE